MKYRNLFLFILPLLLIFPLWSKPLDNIIFITENYPPYNFQKENQIQGISVDILKELLKKTHSSNNNIKILPWARGYHYVQTVKNTALFSMVRTPEREHLFKWVGPIMTTTNSLITLKEKHIKIESIKDLHKYKIGVVRDDIGEQLLLNMGISKLQLESTGGIDAIHKLIKMLNKNRFDIWSYDYSVARWELKKNDYDINNYEIIYTLNKSELYFAFHKETPKKVIKQLQKALDELKNDKKYQEIIDKYLKM